MVRNTVQLKVTISNTGNHVHTVTDAKDLISVIYIVFEKKKKSCTAVKLIVFGCYAYEKKKKVIIIIVENIFSEYIFYSQFCAKPRERIEWGTYRSHQL